MTRAGAPALALAIVTAAGAAVFEVRPFLAVFHTWVFAVLALLVGLLLLAQGIASVRARTRAEGFAALGALGGALLAGSMVVAAFLVGPPHVVQGVPGQFYPVGPGAAISYPEVSAQRLAANDAPSEVAVSAGAGRARLGPDQEVRLGAYVFTARLTPIAYVAARSAKGLPMTVTQPNGATFVSPYLLFPLQRGAQHIDAFAVPALHRTVQVVYYSGLPERGITTPFVLLQVAEENGGVVSQGVTISGKPYRARGVTLTFALGKYPVVSVASAPAPIPFFAGLLMLGAGLVGYFSVGLRRPPTR
ncbi:MAG TPA: hypothetical protein VN934_02555 [Candidatus Tumulicola sp.]|nr:hypothetical protein [Candidatus Tumulicola sp.]